MEYAEVTSRISRTSVWAITILPVVLIIWGFIGVYLLQLAIDSSVRRPERVMQELAYFPSGVALKELAIEYHELVADFIWLTAIDYYGRHQETDRRYEYLGHIFGILTTLDPRFIGAYHFGAITLAWDAHKPDEALKLLYRGMKANPLNWRLPFDAGFINYLLIGDYESAARLFRIAANLPNAWSVVERWVPYATARSGDFATARQMWKELYYNTENRKLKELIVRQLKWLKLEESLAEIQSAVDKFIEQEKRAPASIQELLQKRYLKQIPEEPYGGKFFLDSNRVRTTTPPSRRGEG